MENRVTPSSPNPLIFYKHTQKPELSLFMLQFQAISRYFLHHRSIGVILLKIPAELKMLFLRILQVALTSFQRKTQL